MNMNKRMTVLLWRWPLVGTVAVALFWAIWYQVTGDVPATITVVEIPFTGKVLLTFPSIGRPWLDIATTPILAIVAAYLFTTEDPQSRDVVLAGLIVGLIVGLIWVLGLSLVSGPIFVLSFGLILALGFGLIVALIWSFQRLLYSETFRKVGNWLLAR